MTKDNSAVKVKKILVMTALKEAPPTFVRVPVLDPDYNTLPNYLMVMGPHEKRTRTHKRRKRQVPDKETAAEFWKLYAPEPVEITTLLPSFSGITREDLLRLTPNEEWYFMKEPDGETHARSTHGMQHSLRVGIYARILAENEHLNASQIKILDAVALTHDLGRQNDTVDNNHGKRSAEWLNRQWEVLSTHDIHLNESEREMVQLLCVYHEIPYKRVPARIKEKGGILLNIFRAADALDRYRAPSEAWWPDPQHAGDIQIRSFMEYLMPFAKYFTLATEYYRTHYEPDIVTSTRVIGEQVGLISQSEPLQARRHTILFPELQAK